MEWKPKDHPREKPGASDGGQFRDNPNKKGMPTTASIDTPYGGVEEDPQDLASLYDYLDQDRDEAQQVEFNLPDGTRVTGWAIDDGRIGREGLPEHWHAYSVAEDETDEPDANLMQAKGIDPDTADDEDMEYQTRMRIGDDIHVNHRFDFATTQQLTPQQLDAAASIPQDDWAFTGEQLSDHVYDNGIDPEIYREERRKNILSQAIQNSMRDKNPTPEKIEMLAQAARENTRVNIYGDSPIQALAFAKTTRPGQLPGLSDVLPERMEEMRAPDFKPNRPYIHWNQDGDLETVTAKQRETMLWRNRTAILMATRDDDEAKPATSNKLAELFNN